MKRLPSVQDGSRESLHVQEQLQPEGVTVVVSRASLSTISNAADSFDQNSTGSDNSLGPRRAQLQIFVDREVTMDVEESKVVER
ncbi:hypothetical protein ABW19_dt0202189 [Dactylella cylindrospora]|nr:hypothetical protein ABW19_dt0202189 [Dactylella cylindrospora]